MSAPTKAVFARSQSQARSYARAFELSPEDWTSLSIGSAIPKGRIFENVVVILPAAITAREFALIDRLKGHLDPKGSIALLSPHDEPAPIPHFKDETDERSPLAERAPDRRSDPR